MTEKVKVAIIGAGPAGLCGLSHLSKFPDRFKVTAFEQIGSIGGTWVYTDETGIAKETGLPVHSSMYKNMRCVTVKIYCGIFPTSDMPLDPRTNRRRFTFQQATPHIVPSILIIG